MPDQDHDSGGNRFRIEAEQGGVESILNNVAKIYGLAESTQSRHSLQLDRILYDSAKIIDTFGINKDALKDTERVLLLIAIVSELRRENVMKAKDGDEYEDCDDQEIETLYRLIYLLFSDYTTDSFEPIQKLAGLARIGTPEGIELRPNIENKYEQLVIGNLVPKLLSEIDEEATKSVRLLIDQIGEKSILHNIRTRLNIAPQDEHPFELIISSLPFDKFILENKARGFKISRNGTRYIVIGNPFPDLEMHPQFKETLEHEFVHTQEGATTLKFGYQSIFFGGLNEAITESLITVPRSYPL